MPFLRMWVHCPRASNGLLPRRSNLVGYVRWDAQSDRFPPCQTIIPTAFRSQSGLPVRTPSWPSTVGAIHSQLRDGDRLPARRVVQIEDRNELNRGAGQL